MNGVDNHNHNHNHNHNLDKPLPRYLGRMVNLFDFSAGMAGNRLLTNKPHDDGSYRPRRSLSDVSRLNQFGDLMENNMIVSKSRRNCSRKESIGTPMKILLAQEMSNELDSRHNPPSVVAKLMGLDTLPQEQPDLATKRSRSRGSSRSHSELPMSYWHQDKAYWDLEMAGELHQPPNPNEYKDVYEITQQPRNSNGIRGKSEHKARFDEQLNDKKMDLVRQKFVEAKRLSTDEKLRECPEFDDALEVLNSNKDLFLKFLQDPNSQNLHHLHSVPAQPETKRITILKPCKMFVDEKVSSLVKQTKKPIKWGTLVSDVIGTQKNHLGLSPHVGCEPNESPVQPTKIVVLKPSSGKQQDIKVVVSPPSLSPRVFHNTELMEETENVEARKTRECVKEINEQMCENLSGHQRDETLLSSVFSNGYIGDESSFHKSEDDYAAEILSDVEITSPTSRNSWDYLNSFDSSYSTFSLTHASYSPKSSVCREAKKRLSERWATMTSGEIQVEQINVVRNSSTLREMLVLADTKNKTILVNKDNTEDSEDSALPVVTGSIIPGNLVKLNSVPTFSSVLGTNVKVLHEVDKPEILPKTSKGRNVKSSLKGKVSSLFFSRSRNSNKGKPAASQSKDESESPGTPFEPSKRADNAKTQYPTELVYKECSSGKVAFPEISGEPCIISTEVGMNVANPLSCGNDREGQDQPSPISVLEIPFEEEEQTTESPGNNIPGYSTVLHVTELGTICSLENKAGEILVHSKSNNLIDKSPRIGSVSRTLSWDDSCVDTATSYPLHTYSSCQTAQEEEHEWFSFVETVLSVAGFDGEIQSDMFMSKWYSSESPLDPSLRDEYIDLTEKEVLQEARRRQRRSTCKLVFDCVNTALVEMTGYGRETCQRAIPSWKPYKNISDGGSFIMANEVWSQMKEWFSMEEEERCSEDDYGDFTCLVVERVVKEEVVGKGWVEYLGLEMDNIGLGIEGELLEDLLHESLVEFTVKA